MRRARTQANFFGILARLVTLGVTTGATMGVTLGLHERSAAACGGCFHRPAQPNEVESVITDHRMVFSISMTQTVLWDQVRYSGNPAEFAWVLPVHGGARLELSHDAWIAALAASTATVVTPPASSCGGGAQSGGAGCGSSAASSSFDTPAGPGFSGNGQVQVISQAVVGPYETVTLKASTPNALESWLGANGFDIPARTRPTIAVYVSAGFDFIALKLRPGEGVAAMQPVRIVSPGADAHLPLRMVSAGAGANVGIELYVITEGRFHPQNFPDETIDFNQLTWDGVQQRSNYEALVSAALAEDGGRGWLTEFAGHPNLVQSGTGSRTGVIGGTTPGLADAYFSQCTQFGPASTCDGGAPPLPGADAAMDAASDASSDAPGNDGEAGSMDAQNDGALPGMDASSASCTSSPDNSCDSFDDLSVALAGLHPEDVWVTRLRAFLPASALDRDLWLQPSPVQATLASQHPATKFASGTDPCGGSGSGSSGGGCACGVTPSFENKLGTCLLFGLSALAISVVSRRKRR